HDEVCSDVTALASDLAALEAFAPPALVAADDLQLPGSLPVTRALRFRRLLRAELAAALSQSACAGTSDHAAPPCKQMTPQLPQSASGLPAGDGHKRPCWSDASASRTPAG